MLHSLRHQTVPPRLRGAREPGRQRVQVNVSTGRQEQLFVQDGDRLGGVTAVIYPLPKGDDVVSSVSSERARE